jgi:peptide chain release factor 1
VDERPGFVSASFTGKGARQLFKDEGGGHRWQRIPPNDKRGRVQTSTVTVAVMELPQGVEHRLDMSELEIRTSRGSGPGGQHRNKTDSCVTVVHRPTGETVRVDMRSQHRSKAMALQLLSVRLKDAKARNALTSRNDQRRSQVGSGMRGDKVRTYREQDDSVTDHRNDRRMKLRTWLRGDWVW